MNKNRNGERTALFSGGMGALLAVAISLAFALLIPFSVLSGMVDMNAAIVMIPAVQGISAFLGAVIAGKLTQNNKLLSVGVVSGVYIAILICTGLLFFDGLGEGVVIGILSVIIGSAVAILILNKRKSASKSRGRRQRKR